MTKIFVKKGLTPTGIFNQMNVLDDAAPSFTIMKNWAAEFKHNHTSLEENPRSGRPKSVTTPENINKVHDIVLKIAA